MLILSVWVHCISQNERLLGACVKAVGWGWTHRETVVWTVWEQLWKQNVSKYKVKYVRASREPLLRYALHRLMREVTSSCTERIEPGEKSDTGFLYMDAVWTIWWSKARGTSALRACPTCFCSLGARHKSVVFTLLITRGCVLGVTWIKPISVSSIIPGAPGPRWSMAPSLSADSRSRMIHSQNMVLGVKMTTASIWNWQWHLPSFFMCLSGGHNKPESRSSCCQKDAIAVSSTMV